MTRIVMIALLLVSCGSGAVRGEEIKAIDASNPLLNARIGLAWDIKGTQYGVAYIPIVYVVGKTSGREYFTLNGGVVNKMSNGKVGYNVSVGTRIDTIFAKWGESEFSRKYLRFAVLPPMQISPSFVTQDFKKFTPMLVIASKFGGR